MELNIKAHGNHRTNRKSISHAREKLKRENIKNQKAAIKAHEGVGKKVRGIIADIGDSAPENILPAEPIANVKKCLKKIKLKAPLDKKPKGRLEK